MVKWSKVSQKIVQFFIHLLIEEDSPLFTIIVAGAAS